MPSEDYWKARMEAVEDMIHTRGIEYTAYIDKQFGLAERAIQRKIDYWYNKLADNNEITLEAAKRLLREDELEDFHLSVEEYIEKGKTLNYHNTWQKQLENASAKVHISRLEAMKLQMQQECEVLYGNLTDGLDDTLRDMYTEGYYHTAYEIQKGLNLGWSFNLLDANRIEKAVNTIWTNDGKNFTARCWINKQKLINELNTVLTQNIIRGESPQRAIEQLSKRMKVSRHNAGRLIMTESSFIYSQSQKDCFKELDVERYEFVATLDSSTSETCRRMDGRVLKMSEYEIGVSAPPLHCFCRSVTVPYFDDDVGERIARGQDGKTYYVPSDMKYKEWDKAFVTDGNKDGLMLLSDTDSESELGTFKKRIMQDKGMGKPYYDKLKDKFAHGAGAAKRAFNKYVPNDSIADYMYEGTAKYENGKIYMHYGADLNNPRGIGVTWFHEHGHMIDDLAGDISNNAQFMKALNDDFLDNLSKKSYSEIEATLTDMRKQSAVSDIFNGISRDEIRGVAYHPLRPDGSSYWTEETIRQEAFAHMYECQFDKIRHIEMEKWFPKSLRVFEQLLKGV